MQRELTELHHDDIPVKEDDPHIEMMEQGQELYEIQPGTPRRRRKVRVFPSNF